MTYVDSDCTAEIQITEICHGGACNSNGTGCDCTHTNSTGPLCQFKSNPIVIILYVTTECDTYKYFFDSECDGADASDVNYCKNSGGTCVYSNDSGAKVCYCDNGRLVASNETCTSSGMNGH